MAQSERMTLMHNEQKQLAEEVFKNQYKEYIVKELANELTISYITPESLQNTWRKELAYYKDLESFLLWRTHIFIVLLSNTDKKIDKNLKSPTFLKTFIGLVSDYLSTYTCKKGVNQNDCRQEIRDFLLTNDKYTQIALKRYAAINNEEYASKRKMMHIAQQQERKRKRINPAEATPVALTQEEEAKLRAKQLKRQIKEKQELLGKTTGTAYTRRQNSRYKAQIAWAKAQRLIERQGVLTLKISIKGE